MAQGCGQSFAMRESRAVSRGYSRVSDTEAAAEAVTLPWLDLLTASEEGERRRQEAQRSVRTLAYLRSCARVYDLSQAKESEKM